MAVIDLGSSDVRKATRGGAATGVGHLPGVGQRGVSMAEWVRTPAIVDGDTGFGGAENAARTIQEFERAGLAGCHIEDQEFPKRCGHLAGKTLVAIEDMNEKIAAAAAAKRDKDFLLIARTDARSVESFAKAVERAQSYVAAGADAIFPEALQGRDEFRDFAKAVDTPLLANMTEFGKSPLLSLDELAELGYRMVIYPQTAFRVSMFAAGQMLRDLKKTGTQENWVDRMQTRQELYDLLDYDPTK